MKKNTLEKDKLSTIPAEDPLLNVANKSLFYALFTLILLTLTSFIVLLISLYALGYSLDNPLQPLPLALSIFFGFLVTYPTLMILSKDYFFLIFIPQFTTSSGWLVLSLLSGCLLAFTVNYLSIQMPPPETMQTSIQTILHGNTLSVILVYISVIVLAPLFEEYLFRGLIFDGYQHRFGNLIAISISSVVFMLFHLLEYYQYWIASFAILCLAIVLAIIRYKSRSILNPVLCHAAYNFTILVIA